MDEHDSTNHSGTIQLEAGILYDVRMEFFEAQLDAESKTLVVSTSQPFEVIPTSQLYAATTLDSNPVTNWCRKRFSPD